MSPFSAVTCAASSAALAYYRAMPRELAERETWALLHTPIETPVRVIHGADDGCIGPEMFDRQEKFFATGFELMTPARRRAFRALSSEPAKLPTGCSFTVGDRFGSKSTKLVMSTTSQLSG